jgi:hypothetical protein
VEEVRLVLEIRRDLCIKNLFSEKASHGAGGEIWRFENERQMLDEIFTSW